MIFDKFITFKDYNFLARVAWTINRKIEQDNCFIIQQIGNETHFVDRKSVIM